MQRRAAPPSPNTNEPWRFCDRALLELIAAHGDWATIERAAWWSAGGKNADGSAAAFGGIATHLLERQPDGSLKGAI